MDNIEQVIEAVGRAELRRALGVKDTAISNAVRRGQMPSSWYAIVAGMLEGKGASAPSALFSFKKEGAA